MNPNIPLYSILNVNNGGSLQVADEASVCFNFISSSSWLKHTRHISPILNARATQSFNNNTDLDCYLFDFFNFISSIRPPA
uniref:Uncharacterized protein n=1 Tax=Helianthus annuus TaxID=4232 RepID=A0A251U161_HELAN